MSDITTFWDIKNIRGDWKVSGGALASGDDLTTSVLISLFTDRLASGDDKIPDGSADRRGWWADNQPSGDSIPIGSRLWLLDRRKAPTQKTLNDAKTYAKEALQWMINDGVAAKVDVVAEWNAGNYLAMIATIYRRDGSRVAVNFNWAWGVN